MEIIITLLAIIAISEVSRLFLTHSKTSKKGHFRNKLDGVEKMIYDLEFKRFKTREIREDIRKEYDQMAARKSVVEQRIKNDDKEKTALEDQKVLIERDMGRFEEQMKQLDIEINGSKPSQELPDGASGIIDQIESLRELRGMLKNWIKSL